MHKRKDGKVIASLTEVKNKTGDIFALVDEYGEVLLTSYNKPRYRIVKINIGEVLELKDNDKALEEKKPRVSVFNKVKNTVSSIAPKSETIEEESTPSLLDPEVLKQLSKVKFFDRNNKQEKIFVKKATMPLQ